MDPKDAQTQTPTPAATDTTPPAPPAPAAASAAMPQPSEDEFAAAFADLSKDVAPAPAAPAPAAPAQGEATPAATAATPPAAGSGTEPATAPAAAPAAPDTPPAPAAPDGFVAKSDVQAMIEAALREHAPAAPAAPAPAAPAAPAAPPPPLFTADEQTALDTYHKEWPDVARGESLQRRAEYQQLVQHIFTQLQDYIAPLAEAVQRVPALETDTQYRNLTDAIPDYDVVRDPVIEWVGKQPAYLKAAYEQVTSSGTVEEIADLVDRFKKDTGWTAPAAAAPAPAAPGTAAAPAAAPATAPAAAPAATPAASAAASATASIPAAAAAAAASLKPVKAGRTEPTSAADPNDFDGAWKEFAAAAK